MNCSSTRQAKMNKENTVAAKVEEPSFRITRARAKVLGTSGGILSSKISIKQDQKRVLQTNAKRAASDENKLTVTATADHQHKKRAVLKDVTNVLCESSYTDCINAAKFQPSKWAKRGPAKKSAKVAPSLPSVVAQAEEHTMSKTMQRITQTKAMELPGSLKENVPVQQNSTGSIRDIGPPNLIPVNQTCRKFVRLASPSNKEEDALCDKLEVPNSLVIADIDTKQKDPQMCSIYAPDIYNNIRATELERRPSADFMETVQQDITQSMRGILIDWLVEVSEEYKLVPDTIYLTVNLIDRFLSENYIEKQRLQLLGVTCMLIASKYEEICAPRIEEFCFITDNTYTKEEVLKMESQVLNFLHFQLSVPTTKTFLRRFIQAAQACYKVPSVELEFLANYLAELTLLDYDFIKFLPSLVAASAVFLARWTLDQSDHPWNPTLEHYTNYKAIELKPTVLALQDLQLNTKGGNLNAIREKYRQQKFKCIATLSPSEHVQSLF